ncbi:hypothetical protein AXX17_ATUG04570 [Arabidopsis thaliana]|uniref:DUF1989 domain-containing protein n=1 Tax=Arabidopsis thaliana TaxID=3702 RepID=A0A178U7M2_ARATH|nr:hypothetical protein AXX17_ATUG04570 [Arabidopsis thaliana]
MIVNHTSQEWLIPATEGLGFQLAKGQVVRVTDIEGEQVADFTAYYANDTTERLDPSVTMDALHKMKVTPGDILYSNKYRPILTIVSDTTAGVHDFINSACRPEMYEVLYNKKDHASCYNNINQALAPFGLPVPDQHYPFNLFMNTVIEPDGKIRIDRPVSKAGDYVDLRAEEDLIIAISACPTSESVCNGYRVAYMNAFMTYVVLGLSLSAPVGPINAAQLDRGARFGFAQAWLVGIGAMAADLLFMLLIYFGVAHFLTTPFMKTFLWCFGAFVLLYTGIDSLRNLKRTHGASVREAASNWSSLRSGFLMAMMNPLNILFWLGIYGSILADSMQNQPGSQVLWNTLGIFVGILLWDFVMATLASGFRRFSNQATLQGLSALAGLSLIGFGQQNLPSWQQEAFTAFGRMIADEGDAYPCIPGRHGFASNNLRYGFIPDPRSTEAAQDAALLLDEYGRISRDTGKYASLVLFFHTPEDLSENASVEEYEQLFWRFLTRLSEHDSSPWPPNIPTDPADPAWEFCYGGQPYFAFCATPAHEVRRSRHAPGFLVAFQPRWVFEAINDSTAFGRNMKKLIRNKLADYDSVPAHPSLKWYGQSDNQEWQQYFLRDDETAPSKCPYTAMKNRIKALGLKFHK